MSLNKANEKCVVCKAYLFPEDDVVYCPECGAPHHRDCYNSIGHCAMEEFHGTENEYKKPEQTAENAPKEEPQKSTDGYMNTCRICGKEYPSKESECPECGAPNLSNIGGHMGDRFITIDLMGGVPADMDLGDGVTANEAKKFVGTNAHRYIPKFAEFKNGRKASWNWLGFITPSGWFISRKMYLFGIIIGVIQIAMAMLSIPFTSEISQLDLSEVNNYMEYSNLVFENLQQMSQPAFIAAFLGTAVDVAIRILTGIFGDVIYRKRVINKVNEIKTLEEDQDYAYRKMGGVNLVLGIVALYVVRELPMIIMYLLGSL